MISAGEVIDAGELGLPYIPQATPRRDLPQNACFEINSNPLTADEYVCGTWLIPSSTDDNWQYGMFDGKYSYFMEDEGSEEALQYNTSLDYNNPSAWSTVRVIGAASFDLALDELYMCIVLERP